MRQRQSLAVGTALGTAVALFFTGAQAQVPVRGQGVAERPRPDYDPLGLRAGAFLVYPQVSVGGAYNSNVYARAEDEESDYLFLLRPSLAVQSDWGLHAVALNAAAEIGRYADLESEDYEDYLAEVEARLDLPQQTTFSSRLGYRQDHEDRGSPNAPGGAEPVDYETLFASYVLSRNAGVFGGSLTANWDNLNFEDTEAADGSEIEQDDRDRDEYSLGARLNYNTSPNVAAFVQAVYNWRQYHRDTGRDSDGYSVSGGVALDFGGITTGEIFAGYREQTYDGDQFGTQDGFTYGANVFWSPTGLTTVTFTVANTLEETVEPSTPAYESSEFAVEVDHEMLRNLLLNVGASYSQNDYQENPREDDVYAFQGGAEYLLNRNLAIEASYSYVTRESNIQIRDYDRHTIALRLVGRL